MVAAAGVVILLKKGGEAGVNKVKQVTVPVVTGVVDAAPIHPLVIEGQLDNFIKPIALEAIRSWGAELKYGFVLAVCENPKLNQPRARVALLYPTAAPTVFEIQYTVPQNLFNAIEADPAAKNRFDGVAVQITSQGGTYNASALLILDPQRRADDHKWLSYNLILPPATKEIDFWIAGTPPGYNVFRATCAICLPQLRLAAAKTHDTRSSSTGNP